MRILFIRHAEPDYVHDSLTEKGFREAKLLGERVKEWKVDGLYVSCLGRARRTAEPVEQALGRKAQVLDWLQEFRGVIGKQWGTGEGIPWDFTPRFRTQIPEFYDKDKWYETEVMAGTEDKPVVKDVYLETCRELDKLLAQYGYERENGYYRVKEHSDKTIVLVCHMGITFAMLSHLLGTAFPLMPHGFFLPPSSVTIVSTEEVEEGYASFRCQAVGDVWHLHKNNEPVSGSGYFGEMWQK